MPSQAPPFEVPTQDAVLLTWTHAPAPSQESVPSHAPPFEVPTQEVVEDWKPSAGQAPDVPVQLSATSH